MRLHPSPGAMCRSLTDGIIFFPFHQGGEMPAGKVLDRTFVISAFTQQFCLQAWEKAPSKITNVLILSEC